MIKFQEYAFGFFIIISEEISMGRNWLLRVKIQVPNMEESKGKDIGLGKFLKLLERGSKTRFCRVLRFYEGDTGTFMVAGNSEVQYSPLSLSLSLTHCQPT